MKKILLFADVGGHEYEAYYHAGDEAMLSETYRWYRQAHPTWQLSMLSWFPTHDSLECQELPHLHWDTKQSHLYFPLLLIKLIAWKITGKSFFSTAEFALIETIRKNDRIHFTGGGNLSSQFRQWLYYSFFVIIAAKMYGKEIILTSQTIGPIIGVDRIFACLTLNLPQLIGIRAKTSRKELMRSYGIFKPQIKSMLDAAYSLPPSNYQLPKKTKAIHIGLSVHAWDGWETVVDNIVAELCTTLAQKYTLEITIIPHHLTTQQPNPDSVYMQTIANKLPSTITIHHPSLPNHTTKKTNLASHIKQLTAQTDLLLTTRYHGLIFGLASNVPCIALQLDGYYQMKNHGALELWYGQQANNYQVTLPTKQAKNVPVFRELLGKTTQILDNLSLEKAQLQTINTELSTGTKTLAAVMHTL